MTEWRSHQRQQQRQHDEAVQVAASVPKTYTLLGTPSLVYRPKESYVRPDTQLRPSQLKSLHVNLQALNRTRARWYYPMDHRFRQARPINPAEVAEVLEGKWGGLNSIQKKVVAGYQASQQPENCEPPLVQPEKRGRRQKQRSEDSKQQADIEKKKSTNLKQSKSDEEDASSDEEYSPSDHDDDTETEDEVDEDEMEKMPKRYKRESLKNGAHLPVVWNATDPLYDEEYQRDRSLALLDHARLTMLEAAKEDDLHIPYTISCYRMYDNTYIPAQYGEMLLPRLKLYRFRSTRWLAKERRDYADPAYLAPFGLSTLETMKTTGWDESRKNNQYNSRSHAKRRGLDRNDPNSPSLYGNCLICEPCPCPVCRKKSDDDGNEWCLLYPTGELLDRVRVSRLILPNRNSNDTLVNSELATDPPVKRRSPVELDVGDTIRQIVKCGMVEETPNGSCITLVARTACYVTVFRWTAAKARVDNGAKPSIDCLGSYELERMQTIDLRSGGSHSFTPNDVACHPRFGGAYSDRKIAILSHSKTTRNTIHHVLASDVDSAPLVEKHNIACLSSISQIEFSSTHPMTIWAAAKSYVRPTLTQGLLHEGPFAGNGHSLYLVDLRSDSATFQWSPSAEEFLTEGIHSISGIMTDWDRDNRLWVSSVSAGKTWELDSRMPCKVVSSWSLPGLCDDFGSLLPTTGLHGAGTIFAKPSLLPCHHVDGFVCPMLSVGKSPGSFGLHVYQPSVSQPRFQTQSLEIAGGTIPSRYTAHFVASSMFPLPDVSDKVFTCGVAAFRTLTENFLEKSILETMGCSPEVATHVVSALTMTNKGDIYVHALLEQNSVNTTATRIRDGLPVGSSALVIPPTVARAAVAVAAADGGINLHLVLSNDLPVPSSAVLSQAVNSREDVQPFQTIPLCQPQATALTNKPVNWEPISHPTVGAPVVIVGGQGGSTRAEGSLLIPPHNAENPLIIPEMNQRQEERTIREPKCDITPDILETAANLWDDIN